ncbi:MAG: flagellar transcriptional regulator FlhC [Limnobacter sp.]|nr:flagellar transcriptional regulator FlhC [Limnobacter sp.]
MITKAKKSVLNDATQIRLATAYIQQDARLQVLESETTLSRERLIRLYKEIKQKSPPKGMLPFSTDWFLTWQPNIHSSLFINLFRQLVRNTNMAVSDAIVKAYALYREQIHALDLPEVLSITRAWRLVKFFEADMLKTTPCSRCHGEYVIDTYDLANGYVCGLCNLPSRAGKTRKSAAQRFLMKKQPACLLKESLINSLWRIFGGFDAVSLF